MVNKSVRPAAPYIGGKRVLAPRLAAMIDGIEHRTYCEVFVGMAGVFLRRERIPKVEVINDRSRDVATFFRILQRHYVAFIDTLRYQLTTRAEFERLIAVDPATQTDLERAARFLYLQRTSFGGKVAGRNFGVDPASSGRFDVTTVVPLLEALHERLARVTIECLDFRDFIRRYDRATTLFYLDPPYWGSEGDYGKALFSRDDFGELAEILRGLKGRFVLSINDTPEVREIFDGFALETAEVTYTVGGGAKAKKVGELIIAGP